DRLVKEVLLMVLVMHTEEDDTVLHIEKTGILMLVGGMTADVVDKLACSSDDVQPKQVDLRSAHALTELHWHYTHVDPDRHELHCGSSRWSWELKHGDRHHGPYVRRMIPEPGNLDRKVPVAETFHEQTDEELIDKEVKQMVQEKNAKLFNEWEKFTSNDGNLKFLNNLQPEWRRHVTIVHQTKDLHKADYTQLYDFLKFNQVEKSKWAYCCSGTTNQNGNGNVVAAWAEVNGNGNNGNQIRCYNCKGMGHLARNCTVRPRRRDVAYHQTQLLIA
nr:hypothetical protein [Tanacetum cinerariifolium]